MGKWFTVGDDVRSVKGAEVGETGKPGPRDAGS